MSFPYSHPFLGLSNGLNTKQGGVAGAVGGWVELARTTLGSVGDTITVSSLADKRYYMVLNHEIASGAIYPQLRVNNDSGTNYSSRRNANGNLGPPPDTTLTSRTFIFEGGAASTTSNFGVTYLSNLSSKEKLAIRHTVFQNTAGAGNAPAREEKVGKWANTSSAVNRLDEINGAAGDYNTNSEVVVLGWDPDDTHTNNFWEELADVSYTSGSTIDTGTFTAKKYLWIQAWSKGSSGWYLRANSDTSGNYAWRYSNNGGADGTITTASGFTDNFGFDTLPVFWNYFIINNSSNEKLAIGHSIHQNSAGAGNVPQRQEAVSKWTNTSSQITSIQLTGAGLSGGQIKVWGAD